jgi:hypothetical protein
MLNDERLIEPFAERAVEGARPWAPPAIAGSPFARGIYYLGKGNPALEVCVIPAERRPRRGEVRDLWHARHGKQAAPLLLVCAYSADGKTPALVCGPTDADLAVIEVPFAQAVGLAAGALAEPNGTAATRFLREHTPSSGDGFAGLANHGMFAEHTLRDRVRARSDWNDALEAGRELRGKEDRGLVKSLGFRIEETNTPVSVLRAPGERARGVAVFLERGESYESTGGRFGESSGLSLAFTRADRDNIPFVVLTRGPEIRLYAASRYEGVGRKGQAETYVQANTNLLAEDEVGYLPLIFGARALLEGGSFGEILEWSRDYSAALSERLRDRVYIEVVPTLAVAVANRHADERGHAQVDLEAVYEETLVILFRLLFLGYAEDRGLLPYRSNKDYHAAALKTIARRLADFANEGKSWQGADTTTLWTDVGQLFEAVDRGSRAWAVPPYNGGLFSPDSAISEAGASIAGLKLTDEEFAPALTALLTEKDSAGVAGPIDFRSLSVRDFGTIYEGLLESSLSVATSDLTLDRRGNYAPAAEGDEVEVEEGDIYHHNRSGARKASGSYFTKEFAVEHLLERALELALDRHIAGLEALDAEGDEEGTAQAFFDFRCADIAMGSGHFLVAAVDHIERRLALFLDEHPIPAIEEELDRLRAAARKELGEAADDYEIERRALLRRQVARRCIYGVDRNVIAVELARLSIWIHTFVPGVPLSFLDHNLVQGDSLTGIGTIEEAVGYLTEQASGKAAKHGQTSVFEQLIHDWLEEAKKPLLRLARASDATRSELQKVREAAAEAREKAEPVRKLFDLVGAMRRGEAEPFQLGVSSDELFGHPHLKPAGEASEEMVALHFPVAFPEVFLRDRPGFDCLIGNPPWEKLHVERHNFWTLRFPGLKGMAVGRQNAEIERLAKEHPALQTEYENEAADAERARGALLTGPFPGLGSGHPDLYKAFAWRFVALCRTGGRVGIVLPRAALALSGSAVWREYVLDNGAFDFVTTLFNRAGWVFNDLEHKFTVGLVAVEMGERAPKRVRFNGPYSNLEAYRAAYSEPVFEAPSATFRRWSVGAAFPLLATPASGEAFRALRRAERFDAFGFGGRFRPVQGDLNATADKREMVLDPDDTEGFWPVYKGSSFDLWQPSTGVVYAWADPGHVNKVLQEKRLRQHRHSRSAFSEISLDIIKDPSTLPCLNPRIAFRDVTNRVNQRTVIAALIPPFVIANHKAPFLLRTDGDESDEAYLLGVLASHPFDWYARRFVEAGLSFELLSAFPIPAAPGGLRRRVIQVAARLAAVDDRFAHWAAAVGVDWGPLPEEVHADMRAELDALVSHAYGLGRPAVEHIFETFHERWDHRQWLDRTLAHFEAV